MKPENMKPKKEDKSGIEDFQYVENNIETLRKKYIDPIDKIRSDVGPGDTLNSKTNESSTKINPGILYESRVNAFYRYLGFPVVAPDGSFYNTGYPIVAGINKDARVNIDKKISEAPYKKILDARQEHYEFQKFFYAGQFDFANSVRSIIMGRVPPKFSNIGDGGPLDIDEQKYTISERQDEFINLQFMYEDINEQFQSASSLVSQTIIGPTFNSGQHLLKPFVVDPFISYAVSPEEKSLALPFLENKDSLTISADPKKEVDRPVIESIIRQRLVGVNSNVTIANLASLVNIDITGLSENSFKLTKEIESETCNNLIKTIMSCIDKLISNIEILDQVSSNITWFPVTSTLGPENGDVGATILNLGTKYASISEIKLNALKFKKTLAEGILIVEENLGNFAGPFSIKSSDGRIKDYEREINLLTENNKKWATKGFNALREIEIITGEVSGLGLIDILVIYTALWSIDIKTLIGFLDDESYSRLIEFNPSLKASARLARGKSILDSLQDFEKIVKLILTIVDKLIENKVLNPNQKNSITVT